jgi:hypothetical protein
MPVHTAALGFNYSMKPSGMELGKFCLLERVFGRKKLRVERKNTGTFMLNNQGDRIYDLIPALTDTCYSWLVAPVIVSFGVI